MLPSPIENRIYKHHILAALARRTLYTLITININSSARYQMLKFLNVIRYLNVLKYHQ